MLHILTNPGISPLAEINQGAMLLVIPLVAIWAVGMYFIIRKPTILQDENQPNTVKFSRKLKSVIGLVLLAASSCIGLVGVFQSNATLDKYNSSVVSWLDSGYGIQVNTDIAKRITKGGTFAVTYHGQEIVISVIENINGNLSVVDQNHTVLKADS